MIMVFCPCKARTAPTNVLVSDEHSSDSSPRPEDQHVCIVIQGAGAADALQPRDLAKSLDEPILDQ